MTVMISFPWSGLDDTLVPYIHFLLEQEINGHRLLDITIEELHLFRIEKLGHQEIFMGAIDLLREFVRMILISFLLLSVDLKSILILG